MKTGINATSNACNRWCGRQCRVRDPQEAIALRSLFTFVFRDALRPQTPYGSLGTGIVYLTSYIMYITSTHDLVRLLLSTVPHPRIGGLCCRFFELEAVAPADWLPNSTPPAPIGGGKMPGQLSAGGGQPLRKGSSSGDAPRVPRARREFCRWRVEVGITWPRASWKL